MNGISKIMLIAHVFSAVMLLGPAGAFGAMGKRAQTLGPNGGTEFMKTILEVHKKMVLPGSILSLVTGLVLVSSLGYDKNLSEHTWLLISLVLYIAMLGLATGAQVPAMRRMVAAQEGGSPPAEKDAALVGKVGPILGLLTAAIVILMAWKPTL